MMLTQFDMSLLTSGRRKPHDHHLLTFNEVVNAIVRGLSDHNTEKNMYHYQFPPCKNKFSQLYFDLELKGK